MKRSPAGSRSGPALGSERRPAVDVEFTAGSARTRVAHLPVVVLVAEPLDAVHRDADDLVPDRLGLVVGLVHGDPETIAVESPASRSRIARDEVPAPRDRRLLEVVAEAEVAEHLEEHEVALRATDVVEVVVFAAGTSALLRAHRSVVGRLLVTDEVRLEGHHAGDVEQHRRIVGDQTRGRNARVVLGHEEISKGVTELIGVHRRGHIPAEPIDGASFHRVSNPPDDVHEWISFEDPDEHRTWVFDATYLRSNYMCIYGCGCKGILAEPAPELQQGCCSFGAHFADDEDVANLQRQFERVEARHMQFHRKALKKGFLRDGDPDEDGKPTTMTRLVDGACIFLNRVGFEGGVGCALHLAALDAGERPMDWKPSVCWQVPLRLEHSTDESGHLTSRLREWKRRDWGEGGTTSAGGAPRSPTRSSGVNRSTCRHETTSWSWSEHTSTTPWSNNWNARVGYRSPTRRAAVRKRAGGQ